MEATWNPLQHWNTDEGLDTWLKQQGLQNSQAIINKLALGEEVIFAKGTRRLRYAAGNFYLEAREELVIGTGTSLNLTALQARWQRLVPYTKVTVKFDTHPAAMSLHITERDIANKYSYLIELNPTKLRTPAQVTKMVDKVEQTLTR